MRIYYRTGTALPADIIRQLIPGHSDHAETSAAELVKVMEVFGLEPWAVPLPLNAIRANLIRSIEHGTPPIVLGNWVGPAVAHWVLGVAYSPQGLVVNDPWGGLRRTISWDTIYQQYLGWCIL